MTNGSHRPRSWFGPAAALIVAVAAAAANAALMGAANAASTLERVRANGAVRCAVDHTPGFSAVDALTGKPTGLDVDVCRAVAAATLGDAEAVDILRINTANKFKALVAGEIDVALGMATWTYGRDVGMGVSFPAVVYYDGQGFMAWSDSRIAELTDLRGKKICVQGGVTAQANLEDLQKRQRLETTLIVAKSSEEKFNAFAQRQCDAVAGDRSELAARRAATPDFRARWVVLPDSVSREPLAPAVADNDSQWFDIVRWTVNVMILAEQKGLTSAGVEQADDAGDGETRRLLGREEGFGAKLGLDDQWARRVVRQVGNYGEVFARRLGPETPIGLDRGLNAPWTQGGLMYAPPLR